MLLQEQDVGHASADIHGSGEPTAIPTTISKPHHKHRHDPEPVRGEDAAPLAGPPALILGCQLQLSGLAETASTARPWWADQPGKETGHGLKVKSGVEVETAARKPSAGRATAERDGKGKRASVVSR